MNGMHLTAGLVAIMMATSGAVDSRSADRMDIAIDITPERVTLPPSGIVETKITIKNRGDVPKRTEAVHFTLPAGMTVRSAQGPGWDCSPDVPEEPIINDCYTESSQPPGTSLPPISLTIDARRAGEIHYSVYGFYRSETVPANNSVDQRVVAG